MAVSVVRRTRLKTSRFPHPSGEKLAGSIVCVEPGGAAEAFFGDSSYSSGVQCGEVYSMEIVLTVWKKGKLHRCVVWPVRLIHGQGVQCRRWHVKLPISKIPNDYLLLGVETKSESLTKGI